MCWRWPIRRSLVLSTIENRIFLFIISQSSAVAIKAQLIGNRLLIEATHILRVDKKLGIFLFELNS